MEVEGKEVKRPYGVRTIKMNLNEEKITFQEPNQKPYLSQDPSSLPKKHSSKWEQFS